MSMYSILAIHSSIFLYAITCYLLPGFRRTEPRDLASEMVHPLINQPAPVLTLPDANGKPFEVNPGKNGLPTAIFFYPTSGTYGCTREACDFRDAMKGNEVFKRTSCQVIGISAQSPERQKAFVDEHGLPYPILSDEKGEGRKVYKVTKGLLGLTEGRTTFYIDSQGIVKEVYDSVLNFHEHTKFIQRCLEKESPPAATSTSTAAAPTSAGAA